MEEPIKPCSRTPIIVDKRWPYRQFYFGEEDQERRKTGRGENHWSGAESLEWYTGNFVRDTMHGKGDYRWRYKGPDSVAVTYEGQFYGNRMHGYGVMSYPDGRVFNGLFYNNMRWGPGIETHASLQEAVGLWRGHQLVRLSWKPKTPIVTLDLNTGPDAKSRVESHRTVLTTRVRTIGEVNSAIQLLEQNGAEPIAALEKWTKIYPKHCTDLASQVCHTQLFDLEYYNNRTVDLEEIEALPEPKEEASLDAEDNSSTELYYAWNNSNMMIDMMKHCFKHDEQRSRSGIHLTTVLIGPRSQFKRPAKHELDCRTLIMASYLGHVHDVTKMVNVNNVHPDVADVLGNTALMYATCGNNPAIVHFLVEAGANVNSYNDSCCTPLGVALMQFVSRIKDIGANEMVQAFIPPSGVTHLPSVQDKPSYWYTTTDLPVLNTGSQISKRPSKLPTKYSVLKKPRVSISDEDSNSKKTLNGSTTTSQIPHVKRKTNAFATQIVTENDQKTEDDADDASSEEMRVYNNINTEFKIRVTNVFSSPSTAITTPYLFVVSDMVKCLDIDEEEHKKPIDKNTKKNASKIIKDNMKPSKDMIWQTSDDIDASSINSAERNKAEMLSWNILTVIQLLKDGADPRLVRCPQPALWMATVSGSAELVRHLVQYGADINEVYTEGLNYTALDVAISQPLTSKNVDLIRAILECGGRTNHRLKYSEKDSNIEIPEVPGPTLLHVLLARKIENDREEEIRQELLQLLLEYNCNAQLQFKGHSAVEMAMMKNMDLFEIFIKCPKVDLNAAINSRNQTALVKMFSLQFCWVVPVTERLQTLTMLLLYGADPLLPCQDGEEKYKNIFVFANQNIAQNESLKYTTSVTGGKKADAKKPLEKPKKDDKSLTKPLKEKLDQNDLVDYKQALSLVRDCARLLHIRWIQAKLLKELIKVVKKYEHRPWNMILPEHKNKKPCGLWLTQAKSLQIWDILQTSRTKMLQDRRVLKHLLCIVGFCCIRSKTSFKWPLTADEKGLIETDVSYILREHKIAANMVTENMPWTRHYITPERAVGVDKMFQVCFECALPLDNNKFLCQFCKQVSFCSFECVKLNLDRVGCHPCSESLKMKYFPSPVEKVSEPDI